MGLSTAYSFAIIILVVSIFLTRALFVLPFYRLNNISNDTETSINKTSDEVMRKEIIRITNERPLHAFIFLGSGGHTGEMLRILTNFNEILLKKSNTLYVGYSDEQSHEKFKKLMMSSSCYKDIDVKYYTFIKAREVNAGYLKSLKSIMMTLLSSLYNIIQIKFSMMGEPHLVLLNGPGTCCIIALWFKLIDILLLFTSSHIIYIESLARINTLSMTGKIVYLFADLFVVQWEELIRIVPRAKYFGILV
ncbi:N-acetylglucosaminyldiphosphodolichol N-acetylglucosaminyltransferase anchoring subunit ALG14 [Maudiozyma barnettii]|uniref:UDP-N-acetylglucosamine transferase subunit ALG14 n=1 Tax=Maudiozyma barnettii TaxID=61262 RepID=A0A8H2VD75_9SACH|nr:N-acetylglucosaminyldiphosphodolichol N-acetylglucosaminyltransferase anchoring subunit ALG14 [Kazachstania barnettii]CAB4253113.1 similar to Saccharomyces cerevisiae YBR070C ALG14 Component of UDP-GlcNAc transferase required for the second step of dolichyl-linked oligosaccharide synthesis [Kazachstania barnettii]